MRAAFAAMTRFLREVQNAPRLTAVERDSGSRLAEMFPGTGAEAAARPAAGLTQRPSRPSNTTIQHSQNGCEHLIQLLVLGRERPGSSRVFGNGWRLAEQGSPRLLACGGSDRLPKCEAGTVPQMDGPPQQFPRDLNGSRGTGPHSKSRGSRGFPRPVEGIPSNT